MIVNSFEQSCAVCHADNIAKSSSVAFFRVPGIDVISLARAGISIGQWPKDADDKLTPFMELLLGADISGGKLLATLKGKDLLDLSSASPEQLAAASRLAADKIPLSGTILNDWNPRSDSSAYSSYLAVETDVEVETDIETEAETEREKALL